MVVVSGRWVGDGDTLLYWPKVLLRPSQHFFLILAGVAQPWVTEGRKPSVCKLILTLASYIQLTQAVCALVILLFNVHLLPLFFRLVTQVNLLIDGSVEGQYKTLSPHHKWTGEPKNFVCVLLAGYPNKTIKFCEKGLNRCLSFFHFKLQTLTVNLNLFL